jgi:NAD(P)-dependent dehydrogenase (short-subunit alcohol dehydrogenase family)
MVDRRVWFITGAGRGMGVDIAEAALAAGHAVVATGRNTDAVADAVGETDEPRTGSLRKLPVARLERITRCSSDSPSFFVNEHQRKRSPGAARPAWMSATWRRVARR